MEYVENHDQKLTKNMYMVRRWSAMVWTGTNRISRYQLMDEFGETFTELEFSEKIVSKGQFEAFCKISDNQPRKYMFRTK